jgi:hypothetical protein
MPEIKLQQLQYENEAWKRLIAFMMDENIHLKNRLSDILKLKFNESLLEDMEEFHSRFIKEDQMIGLLRNEVAEMDKLLVREIFENGKIAQEVDRNLKKLRNNISNAEEQFSKLKSDFTHYLSTKLTDVITIKE